jgi:hypothetical protein
MFKRHFLPLFGAPRSYGVLHFNVCTYKRKKERERERDNKIEIEGRERERNINRER